MKLRDFRYKIPEVDNIKQQQQVVQFKSYDAVSNESRNDDFEQPKGTLLCFLNSFI